MKPKTLKINEKLHNDLKNYCNKNFIKINNLVEFIIQEYLKNKNQI
jgi:hypothetical protein